MPQNVDVNGVIVEFPDGMRPEEIAAVIRRNEGKLTQKAPTIGSELMGSIPVQMMMGGVRGAGSIGATLMRPFESSTANEARRADMTGALESAGAKPDSMSFGAGKILGEIAGTAGIGPALAKPIAGALPRVAQALSTGGMSTGLNPVGLPQQVGNMALRVGAGGTVGGLSAGAVNQGDAGMGAAIGAALPPATKAAGLAGQMIGRGLGGVSPNADLARKAINQYGIPLGIGDVTQAPVTKAARSILNDAPITGAIGAGQRERVQSGFNRAVGQTFGANSDTLTLDVIDAAKKRMGAEFDRIWSNNPLNVDAQFVQDLHTQLARSQSLNPEQAASVQRQVTNLLNKVDPQNNIPGQFANNWQSELRLVAESEKGLHKDILNNIRQAAVKAFNRNISQADAAALTLNREQYKAFKTVEPLMRSAEAGVAGRSAGDVPAALLPQAVAKSYQGANSVPLRDLSQIGSQFLVDRVARTGGSTRAALQNTAIGAALMGLGATNPMLAAAAIPAAIGTQSVLGSPALARGLLMASPQISEGLLQTGYRAAPLLTAQ